MNFTTENILSIREKMIDGENISRAKNYTLGNDPDTIKYPMNRSVEELYIYTKCANDIFRFILESGIVLNSVQKDIIEALMINRLNIAEYEDDIKDDLYDAIAVYLLYRVTFDIKKSFLIIGLKENGINIIERISGYYKKLPFFLKFMVKRMVKNKISVNNGCEIYSTVHNKNTTIGLGYNVNEVIMIDNKDKVTNEFYQIIFPCVMAHIGSKVSIFQKSNESNMFINELINGSLYSKDHPKQNNYKYALFKK